MFPAGRMDELWDTAGSGDVERFGPLEAWPRRSDRFQLRIIQSDHQRMGRGFSSFKIVIFELFSAILPDPIQKLPWRCWRLGNLPQQTELQVVNQGW